MCELGSGWDAVGVRLMPARQTKRHLVMPASHKRAFEAHGGICGYCQNPIVGTYKSGHALPLALGNANGDDGNKVPVRVECHWLKTSGRETPPPRREPRWCRPCSRWDEKNDSVGENVIFLGVSAPGEPGAHPVSGSAKE